MTAFTIERNNYLTQNIQGFYHTDFGGVDLPNNPNYLYKLKNDPHHNWSDFRIQEAQQLLLKVLLIDLPEIVSQINEHPLTVCVVPRAKADNTYRSNQLLFKATVRNAVNHLGNNFIDGTNFIVRHTNTKTTCKLPQKQYVLKVDKFCNFKNVKHEKESIQSNTNCQYSKGI